MVDNEQLRTALGKLIGWLQSWRTSEGAYNGFVVHRYEQKRMFRTHDTAWTQAAMIRGFANLVSKGDSAEWRDAMTLAADLQANRLDTGTGKYRYAGHENDRFCSLVHCALANCALLSVLPNVDDGRRQRCIDVVRTNIDRYVLPALWVPDEGAFRFSEVDYYSPGEDRFVINFNMMAAENLLGLAAATGESRYRDIAEQVGQWLLAKWRDRGRARQDGETFDNIPFAEDAPAAPPDGLAYQYSSSRRTSNNCVTIYSGLALRGIRALHDATGHEEYAGILRDVAAFLLAMRDPQTRLFYHTTSQGRIVPHPQFIAGAGMTLLGLHETMPVTGENAIPWDTVGAILDRSHANGAAPGFVGKNLNRPGGKPGVVWEDVAASVNWNAQWFEYLTRLVDTSDGIRVAAPGRVCVLSKWCAYRDSLGSVAILSWWPPKSMLLYWAGKRRSHALLCLSWQWIREVLGRVKRLLIGRRGRA